MDLLKHAIASRQSYSEILAMHMQQANTSGEKSQGLRGANPNTGMIFNNSSGDFTTTGMTHNLNITKQDNDGNIVQSYRGVEPGIGNLPMGNKTGTVIETPALYQEPTVNFENLEKGIRHVESLDGLLMKNKQSSASGYYGQLFDEIDYTGTRDEFIADVDYQKELFKKRYEGKIEGVPGLERNGIELYNEYSTQIDNFNLTPTEIAALSNMLGRQGTRNYLGRVLRDGESLETVFPKLYGDKRQKGKDGKLLENKTPDQYLAAFNSALVETKEEASKYKQPSINNWYTQGKNKK